MENLLKSFPVVIEIPVAWGHMDAFQHVNNVMYFRYLESSRIAYCERLNYFELMDETGIGPILASTQCRFKFPLTYPDTVSVGAKVAEIEQERFFMKYRIVSHRHARTVAEGDGVIVSFNYRENKKAPIPEKLRQQILALERTVQE